MLSRSKAWRSPTLVLGLVLLVGVFGLSCAPPGQGGTSPCANKPVPVRYRHVVWIWMENKTYSEVIGSSSAPYLTWLARQCAAATSEATVGSPSLPNYIGATTGQTFGITDDASPSAHPITADNIFRQVRAQNGSARSYQEAMPSKCALTSSGQYAVRHNPAAYFSASADRTACLRDDVPMGSTTSGAFVQAIKDDTLPTLAFVTPNLCNDTHDCPVAVGDSWLASWVPKITASAAYARGDTAIVIACDEPTPVLNVWVAPSTKPGARATYSTSHYAALRTIEEMLGLPRLGGAANAASYRTTFHL
jgi:hypothetical protein